MPRRTWRRFKPSAVQAAGVSLELFVEDRMGGWAIRTTSSMMNQAAVFQ